jgi:metallophosphoesterase (TIGR00282 family)
MPEPPAAERAAAESSRDAPSPGRSADAGGPAARAGEARILFIGDIVASAGRRALGHWLPLLRERHDPTFVVANGENAAGGAGITPKIAEELLAGGVDAITLGNHAYHRREIYPYFDRQPRLLRPVNYVHSQPGRGSCVIERDGVRLGVINVSGNLFMRAGHPAFGEVDRALRELGDVEHVLVDMHAEATSEKVAMGWHLDGRATAVVGTHTHVPTADARVLPGGTAYITDVGMTGARGGVIGVDRGHAIDGFLTQLPTRFAPAEDDPWLMGVLIRCTRRRRADAIEPLLLPVPG